MCAGQRVLRVLWSVALERTLGELGVPLQIYHRAGKVVPAIYHWCCKLEFVVSLGHLKVIVVSPDHFTVQVYCPRYMPPRESTHFESLQTWESVLPAVRRRSVSTDLEQRRTTHTTVL